MISKSGTTTETSDASFRVFQRTLGEEIRSRRSQQRSTQQLTVPKVLRREADANGWETFVVPDDIGGRFSLDTSWIKPHCCNQLISKPLWKVRMQPGKAHTSDKLSETKLLNTQLFVTSLTVVAMQLKSCKSTCFSPFSILSEWWNNWLVSQKGKTKRYLPTSANLNRF